MIWLLVIGYLVLVVCWCKLLYQIIHQMLVKGSDAKAITAILAIAWPVTLVVILIEAVLVYIFKES